MRYLIGRLMWALLILVGTTAITFAIVFLVPGDPARVVAGPRADAATIASIRRELALDLPVPVQYGRYVGRLLRGDLGRSYATREPVAEILARRLPSTALLAATGLAIAIVIGLLGGLVTAPLAGTWMDRTALVLSLGLLSAPVFWLGMLALYYVGYRWRLLPLGGAGDVRHLILPALVLGTGTGVYYARLLHTNLVSVLGADYVRAARARGASALRVVAVHALRNAGLPLLTVIGLDFAALLNGVVLTETVFHWPGLGRLAFDAVLSLDVPVIMGTVLLSAFLVVASNLAIDLLYRVVDPRIRLG
ncbi:MAG: ABC transporter permease [Deltaproteobacteria bacterium]|nr:MAG: ABC transporter permease [Deltaproteobacteria bacterium]